MIRSLTVVFALIAAVSAHAQPHNQDILAGTSGSLLRLAPLGVVSTIGTYSTFRITGIASDADNRFAVIAHTNPFGGAPNDILRVDLTTGAIVTTVWSGAPFSGPIEAISIDQNGDYVVLDPGTGFPQTAALFRLDRLGAQVTTISTLTGLWVDDFTLDRTSGDWFVTDGNGSAIRRIDRLTGAIVATHKVASGLVYSVTQDPHLADLYVAGSSNESVIRVDPSNGAAQTIATGFQSASIIVDREIAPDGALIVVADRTGVVRRIRRNGFEEVARGVLATRPWSIEFRKARNVAPVLAVPPNDRQIVIDFPDQPGRAYVCAFGVSGYTGGLKLGDGRVIPLRLDGLALRTAAGPLPPVIVNNIGVLDGNGRAVVAMNANVFGGAVGSVRVWVAAITIDPAAPGGIGRVSHPTLIVL